MEVKLNPPPLGLILTHLRITWHVTHVLSRYNRHLPLVGAPFSSRLTLKTCNEFQRWVNVSLKYCKICDRMSGGWNICLWRAFWASLAIGDLCAIVLDDLCFIRKLSKWNILGLCTYGLLANITVWQNFLVSLFPSKTHK